MPRTSTVGRGVACERAQWVRGDPESRKTFGEEERRRSGFRRFAKRNTVKAEFAATKRTGYGAGAGESRREQRARRPLRQEDLDPAAPPTRGLGVGRGARGVRIVPFFTAGSRPRPTVAFPVRYVARRCDLSWKNLCGAAVAAVRSSAPSFVSLASCETRFARFCRETPPDGGGICGSK